MGSQSLSFHSAEVKEFPLLVEALSPSIQFSDLNRITIGIKKGQMIRGTSSRSVPSHIVFRRINIQRAKMRVVVQRAVMTGVTVAAVAVVTSAGFGSQVMPQIVPVRNYVPSIKAVGVRTGSEADLLEIAHASAVPIPVPVEIQYTEIKGQSRAGVTRMNMNYKIGVVSLLIIGIATLITSLTTSGIFTRIGTIGIVGLSVFGIYAFKGDSGSRKGRS